MFDVDLKDSPTPSHATCSSDFQFTKDNYCLLPPPPSLIDNPFMLAYVSPLLPFLFFFFSFFFYQRRFYLYKYVDVREIIKVFFKIFEP